MSIDSETARQYAAYLTQNTRNPYGVMQLMLGTKMVVRGDDGIRFDLHRAKHRVTMCELNYDAGEDLFELKFFRRGKSEWPGVPGDMEEYVSKPRLFFDDLKRVFEEFTGLSLTVPRVIFG